MYKDYDVVYQSNINEYLILWIILGIIALILLIITLISISKVLKKANRSPILGLIPIYNFIPLLEITNMPKSYFIPLIIPIVNIPFLLMLDLELAKLFKKDKNFGILLLVLPFISFPMLAFGKSEYIGINIIAMNSKNTVKDIPMIDDEKNNPIEKEINDELDVSTKSSNISLGGGKYQKNYKNSLLAVEEDMKAKGEIKKEIKHKEIITDGKFFKADLLGTEKNNTSIENENTTNTNDNKTNPFDVTFIDNKVNTNNNEVQEQTVDNQVDKEEKQKIDLLNTDNVTRYRTCPNCGTRVAGNSNMCIICGQKL